jgi:hypothetical protein
VTFTHRYPPRSLKSDFGWKRDTINFVLIGGGRSFIFIIIIFFFKTFRRRALRFYPGLSFFDFAATVCAATVPGRNEPHPLHVREVLTFNQHCGSKDDRCTHGSKTRAAFASASSE